jgi:adenylate kinase
VVPATRLADFSLPGDPVKGRYLVLGPAGSAPAHWARSLNLEHVSAADLLRRQIARPADLPPTRREAATLAALRRWFWARRPEAGFVLTDFPATLLQALVFDEWLEVRDQALTACLVSEPAQVPATLLEHYRVRGPDPVGFTFPAAA